MRPCAGWQQQSPPVLHRHKMEAAWAGHNSGGLGAPLAPLQRCGLCHLLTLGTWLALHCNCRLDRSSEHCKASAAFSRLLYGHKSIFCPCSREASHCSSAGSVPKAWQCQGGTGEGTAICVIHLHGREDSSTTEKQIIPVNDSDPPST